VSQLRWQRGKAHIASIRAGAANGYESLFDEYAKLDAQARELRAQVDALTAENETLRQDVASRWVPEADARAVTRPTALDDRPEPKTVIEAVEEAKRRSTHVTFLDEAFASARESPYKQPVRVYSALLAIEDVARAWRAQLAGGPGIGSRHAAFRQRGFEYKDDISDIAEGRWGDEYTYTYEGRRVLFAPHITIGAKSADRCISIHMHWDEAKRRVVIAHVGRHKTNTRT
jgi:outer membrane murein-binding lipoprotein Lpp